LNSILFNAKNNAKKSKIANLVIETSSFSNNNAIIIKDLNNEDKIAYILRVFVLEDNNDLSIVSLESFLNRFTSLESTKFKRSKIAKQFRKSIAFAKFVDNKKISKRSKQVRISVANNISLDVLQQTFSNYFKDQIQSIRNLLRQQLSIKKIKNILQKYLKKIKKMYQKEIKK